MPHLAQRKQNNCLDCGAVVYGRFCHVCGQENIEPKESFLHLVTHLIYDITHFDGKFFNSVKYLLFRPGFLPAEYLAGKRARYLNPVKMYVFISAFFFLFFFSVINPSFETGKEEPEQLTYGNLKPRLQGKINDLQKNIKDKDYSVVTKKRMENQVQLLQQDLQTLTRDTAHLSELNFYKVKGLTSIFGQYKDVAQYDSEQNALPQKQRKSWPERMIIRKSINLQSKYNYNGNELLQSLLEKFRHSFPQLLFVSLPLFALLLKLLYIRRKRFYYVDHVIYTVHLYCAMFILLFIILGLSQLQDFKYMHWLKWLGDCLVIFAFWYQYKSLRNFYDQGRLKTVVKYLSLLLMSTVVMSLLFLVFLVLSVFKL